MSTGCKSDTRFFKKDDNDTAPRDMSDVAESIASVSQLTLYFIMAQFGAFFLGLQ